MTTKRSYTQQFRDEAVRLVLQEGLSTPAAARRIEVSEKTLANWVRLARSGKLPKSEPQPGERKAHSVSDLEMEVSRLRAENKPVMEIPQLCMNYYETNRHFLGLSSTALRLRDSVAFEGPMLQSASSTKTDLHRIRTTA